MKITVIILGIIALTAGCCGQSNAKKQANVTNAEHTTLFENEEVNLVQNEVELKEYSASGLFLKGEIRLVDSSLNSIGRIEVDEITFVQILKKSSKMYNIEGCTEYCEKAYLLQVEYMGNNYIVFGQDVYKIDNTAKFSVISEKKENLTLFPIRNFKMGSSDETGSTWCSDYSLLILQNEKKKYYSLIKYSGSTLYGENLPYKYATLSHDNYSYEEIYKISLEKDILVVGIKVWYQEGGEIYNLKVNLSSDLLEAEISDEIRFEESELEKMKDIK